MQEQLLIEKQAGKQLVMGKITGPWYRLGEAADVLGLHESELIHFASRGDLTPVVVTKERRLLVYYIGDQGNWTGLGSCLYRGHVGVSAACYRNLLSGESYQIRNQVLQVLEMDGAYSWDSAYPYSHPIPFDFIENWQKIKYPDELILQLRAIPFPTEFYPVRLTVQNFLQGFTDLNKGDGQPIQFPALAPKDPNLMELGFSDHGNFEPGDLRIPASEITKYRKQSALGIRERAEESGLCAQNQPKHRENQLHSLILRILRSDPEITPKLTWRAIEKDAALDERLFDVDHILEAVDADCISWCSRHGARQSLTYTSFATTVGRLKKRLTASRGASREFL